MKKADYIKGLSLENGMTVAAFKLFLKKSKTKLVKCDCKHRVCRGWLLVNGRTIGHFTK